MPSSSAQHWADLVNAVDAQRRRLGMATWADRWTRAAASGVAGFRQDRIANWTPASRSSRRTSSRRTCCSISAAARGAMRCRSLSAAAR
jgi:hypothetical protein